MSIHDSIHKVSKGFAYERNGYKVDGVMGIFATYDEAEQAAKKLLPVPAPADPTRDFERHAMGYLTLVGKQQVVADRQAARVARMVPSIGVPTPKATGRCHYCNLPLTKGHCEECN